MAKPKLGSGARFAKLSKTLSGEHGITNAGALAAHIGRQKFGAKRFNALAARGRKR